MAHLRWVSEEPGDTWVTEQRQGGESLFRIYVDSLGQFQLGCAGVPKDGSLGAFPTLEAAKTEPPTWTDSCQRPDGGWQRSPAPPKLVLPGGRSNYTPVGEIHLWPTRRDQ